MEVDFGGEADELLEILGDELRPAVTDDARPGVGKLQARPLGSLCRRWCRPSHRGSPTKWAPLPCRHSASLAQTLQGATRSIKAHERPWQRLCNMRAYWANPSNCWMPHFRRARRQSGARAQCVPVQPPVE